MGKCAVVGCGALVIDEENGTMTVDGTVYKKGDWLSIDGSTGKIYTPKVKTVDTKITDDFKTLME